MRAIILLTVLFPLFVHAAEKDVHKNCPMGYASHNVAFFSSMSCSDAAKKYLTPNDDFYCEKNGSNTVLLKLLACHTKTYKSKFRSQ